MTLRFGSVCSGIEAASVAFGPLGWKAAWFSEIEKFPSAVLDHHYPDVPNLGDMTQIAKAVLLGEVEAPDMLCGGTPCQAFSVAGLRQSLADDRGNLTLKFVELLDAIDHVRGMRGKPSCIGFWENVPGVLSTEDNAFGCLLAGLAGEDGALEPPEPRPADGRSSRHWKWNRKLGCHVASWSNAGAVYGPQRAVAWRTLDAQYFGLAQRRRRVFVVASARDGFDPAQVLFEWDGLRRDSAPSRKAGEEAAATLDARAEGGGFPGTDGACGGHVQPVAYGGNRISGPRDVASALSAHGGTGRHDFETETFVTHSLRGEGFDASEDGTGRGTPLVPVAFDTTQITSAANYSKPKPGDPCHPLAAGAHPPAIAFSSKDHGADATADLAPTLRAMNHAKSHANGGGQMAVAHAFDARQSDVLQYGDRTGPLDTDGQTIGLQVGMSVRRLTPTECERLQGFPDGYTAIQWRGKPASECPDGPRYKALGNSWAVPCARWIGERIDREVQRLNLREAA
ncbi:DNA cytosine methyltransferase [Roseateles sp.]|uniref:DNA cytosine methyltransferase n=1 Tax=Roseateles sp. TaxID=1971397 RepID=UPI0031DEACA2